VGPNLYPQQPILGNGGSNTGKLNNSAFIYNLFKVFGMHVSPGNTLINAVNFAVDFREFDYGVIGKSPASIANPIPGGPNLPGPPIDLPGGGLSFSGYNKWHPRWGLSYFLENRIIGKAVYGYDFDSMNYDSARMVSGINTYNSKPFTIMLGTTNQRSYGPGLTTNYPGTTNAFDVESYVFCAYDLILKLSPINVTSEGVQ
jgi:hypothetical protein